jgi:hypothetical protein
MDRSPDSNPAEAIVGSVHSAEQRVTMPGIVTVTRSRVWRVSPWSIVAGAIVPELLQLVHELVSRVNNG